MPLSVVTPSQWRHRQHSSFTHALDASGTRLRSAPWPWTWTTWRGSKPSDPACRPSPTVCSGPRPRFAVHALARATALETTDTGQIVVDRGPRSVSHPDVYAIGDAALAIGAGGKPLRMSCASGVPMAWLAADALAARPTSRKLPKVALRYFNQCVSLGRREGLINPVRHRR
jgi:hypothetical protein